MYILNLIGVYWDIIKPQKCTNYPMHITNINGKSFPISLLSNLSPYLQWVGVENKYGQKYKSNGFLEMLFMFKTFDQSNNFYTKEKLLSYYLDAITKRISNFLMNFIYDRIHYKVLYINISYIEHLALKHTPFTTCNSLCAYLCAAIYLIHEIPVWVGLTLYPIHTSSNTITFNDIQFCSSYLVI